ncbi:Lipid phosphate phosphatase 1 [Phytophthora citrophthora]|uniref:Lipid phosphate phosphatase 1 n=1 Tax=Phytophthora citrophthora TaxID=4793 RepID=A0AAD9G267_9STRA|nr:Lipid phosphate phosphatase 1 [Phytophthora citrophthora]
MLWNYEAMVASPIMSISAIDHAQSAVDSKYDTAVDISDEGTPTQRSWKELMREYRALEFGATVILYALAGVFAAIDVTKRPIPGIRVRLNSTTDSSMLRGGKKSVTMFMCCAPLLLAAWICITRSIDNWHHYSDILAGSIVGAVSAIFSFSSHYGPIFSWRYAGLPLETIHERFDGKQGLAGKHTNTEKTYRSMRPSPPANAYSTTAFDTTRPSDATSIEIVQEDDDEPPSTLKRVFRKYRVLEFCCTLVIYLLALVFATIKVNERPIPGIKVRLNATTTVWALDPSLDRKKLTEQVPMWAVVAFGLALPIAVNLVVNFVLPRFCQVRVIAHDTRDFLLSLFQSTAIATFATQFAKNMTGRFRPCFYDMCKWNYDAVWDGVTNLCTDAAGEKEGRKSFPSGHTSFAWSTMLVLTLYLLGRSQLNYERRGISMLQGGKKSTMFFFSCAPVLLASWVTLTRCIDNWHHYSDILASGVIGAASAIFAFSYNYGSIFSWESAGLPLEEIHERRMVK